MKWRYKNFKHLLYLVVLKKKLKHCSVFWGPRASGIDNKHVSVFSPDVLSDGLSWSFDKFQNEKMPMFTVSSPLWIYKVQTFFSKGKGNISDCKVHGKRCDSVGTDKINYLFLETEKSAVEFWVDAIT